MVKSCLPATRRRYPQDLNSQINCCGSLEFHQKLEGRVTFHSLIGCHWCTPSFGCVKALLCCLILCLFRTLSYSYTYTSVPALMNEQWRMHLYAFNEAFCSCSFNITHINLIERTNKMQPCSKFIIPVFLNCSTCFGRHTAHYRELKNCNCSLWFYIRLWLRVVAMAEPS